MTYNTPENVFFKNKINAEISFRLKLIYATPFVYSPRLRAGTAQEQRSINATTFKITRYFDKGIYRSVSEEKKTVPGWMKATLSPYEFNHHIYINFNR